MTLPTPIMLLSTLISVTPPASSAPPAAAAMPWLLGAVLGALGAGLWALSQQRRHQHALSSQHRALGALQDAQAKAALGHSQALKQGKAQLKATEIALAAQKKKNFDQHLQLQEALAQGRAAQERADEAIAEAQRARREAEATLLDAGARGPRAKVAKVAKGTPAPGQTPEAAPAQAQPMPASAAAAPEPTDAERAAQEAQEALAQTLAAAEQALAEISAQKQTLLQDLKEARRREARKDKRIEDLRRVDLMSRGKIEVLEDKVKRLGRELYEAISALAVAKGQVNPVPGPRAPQGQPPRTPEAKLS
jgi:chromosome segregation ATPase